MSFPVFSRVWITLCRRVVAVGEPEGEVGGKPGRDRQPAFECVGSAVAYGEWCSGRSGRAESARGVKIFRTDRSVCKTADSRNEAHHRECHDYPPRDPVDKPH